MHYLEAAVFKHLSSQTSHVGLDRGYYTIDLIQDVVDDPRIAEAGLDLAAYKDLIGDAAWKALLQKHAH